MPKQIALLAVAGTLFVGIWVLVILQVTGDPYSQPITDLGQFETIETIEIIDDEMVSTEVAEEETVEEDLEKVLTEENVEKVVNTVTQKDDSINLSNYDFSDISTENGIPIDGILTKLNLVK
ncbi:hypothetical protein [Bacillus suaedae]|uniref:Uncharacterized protein n=1 Tax=Halalkalibacter suaedae TaxID=2822140 RepID=A0A940WUS7_9BACI|nr:hypothetical protein [Bacillus suaedae]MBP3950658.1 hypothetical protein [Bacillus suaedae]